MKFKKYLITFITVVVAASIILFCERFFYNDYSTNKIKVGFVYLSDQATAYTNNFYSAQIELQEAFGDKVETVVKYNIPEQQAEVNAALLELIFQKCDLIFTTSYGYGEYTKEVAAQFPNVQFCQATCSNANEEPVLPNYHNFMGRIYEARYVSGVIAGLKLLQLLQEGKINSNNVELGYVGAFPCAEVISGFTAFYLGVQGIIPDAKMIVRYTYTWSDFLEEKKCAEKLIQDGCVIIAQHSDTIGPAVACEEASVRKGKTVFHIGYNQTMTDVAPTTSLVSCRINWAPYVTKATEALLKKKNIESYIKSKLKGNDVGFGFDKKWVEIIGLNNLIVPKDTIEEMEKVISKFESNNLTVFQGDFIGMNPFDDEDVWNLRTPYYENEKQSAPSFCYILKSAITVIE